jgi:DNA processing protein
MALEQDRQVFAVPGSPLTGKTRGSNRLLKQGARLVECVEDVVEELIPQLASPLTEPAASGAPPMHIPQATAKPALTLRARDRDLKEAEAPDAKMILQCLRDAGKLHVDSIIEGSGLTAATVLKLLLELELTGSVIQHPGKLFSLSSS